MGWKYWFSVAGAGFNAGVSPKTRASSWIVTTLLPSDALDLSVLICCGIGILFILVFLPLAAAAKELSEEIEVSEMSSELSDLENFFLVRLLCFEDFLCFTDESLCLFELLRFVELLLGIACFAPLLRLPELLLLDEGGESSGELGP